MLVEEQPERGPKPAYASVRRYMKACGLFKRQRRGPAHSPGAQAAEQRFESREVRSYESDYVNALWHLDFHHGSARVLLDNGHWAYPILLALLDDHSRLCCHAQWYLAEGAEKLCHGLAQAFQKRALPRALMSDNGSRPCSRPKPSRAWRAWVSSTKPALPYSPYQNGKQETFWTQIEGRLLPMLESVADLTLRQLNEATLAWVEMEYNRKLHSELGQTPLQRYLNDKDVGRPCPATEQLQLALTNEIRRVQRRSDGTLSLEGIRFELPSRYGHFERVTVRVAAWDLSRVYLFRPANRHHSLPTLSAGQKQERPGPARRQGFAERIACCPVGHPRCHRTTAAEAHQTIRHHRPASGLPAQRRTARRHQPS